MSRRHKVPTTDQQFLQSSARVLVIVNEQNFQTLLRSFTAYFARHGSYFSGRKCLHRQDECRPAIAAVALRRSEEHTSELQSQSNLVCRLLLENKKIANL